jgi:hypothetical protein
VKKGGDVWPSMVNLRSVPGGLWFHENLIFLRLGDRIGRFSWPCRRRYVGAGYINAGLDH